MSSIDPFKHVQAKILAAPIQLAPFPHIYVEDVFPTGYYMDLLRATRSSQLENLKKSGRVGSGYPEERFSANMVDLVKQDGVKEFWAETAKWFIGGDLARTFMTVFKQQIGERHKGKKFVNDSLLIEDETEYKLGPHTDAPHKVISALFYLAESTYHPYLGTSLYEPLDPSFICEGGPHYDFDKFKLTKTMAYMPNTLFAFVKTNNSFHGVEPTVYPRKVLLFNLNVKG